ncbi:MAG: hypothetical protein V4463_08725 [Pseudomonadota bacterium]
MNKLPLLALCLLAASAQAKFPPPSEEAKAAAAAAKDKTAWSDKVAAYKLCLAQDRVAAGYLKAKGLKKPAIEVPACADPGPYVATVAAASKVGVADAKPVPAAGKQPTPTKH